MGYRLAADAVLLAHFGFLLFVALGGFLAWRHRWVAWPHAVAVGWGLVSVFVGVGCPLTYWEDRLRTAAGGQGLPRGFVDTYLTGVIYPVGHLVTAQLLVAGLVLMSWVGVARHRLGGRSRRAFVDEVERGHAVPPSPPRGSAPVTWAAGPPVTPAPPCVRDGCLRRETAARPAATPE